LDVQSSAQHGNYAFPKKTKSPQTDELMDFINRDLWKMMAKNNNKFLCLQGDKNAA
jgi:hypothetical protein